MSDDAEIRFLVQWAAIAGAHALPLFAVLLALALAGTWGGWLALQRYRPPHDRSTLPPLAYLVSRLATGFGVIVAGAWVFAELAEDVGAQGDLARVDQAFTDGLHRTLPPGALVPFALVTRLGDPAWLVAVGVAVGLALLVRGKRGLTLGWTFALGGSALLNYSLKQVFERLRPVHADGPVAATGYSFPSGHSSGSVVVYGMLAYLALRALPPRWHLPAMLGAVALAFTVGASRAFLRVHYASDVLAGFASGAAWLAVCIVSIELTRWYRRRPG